MFGMTPATQRLRDDNRGSVAIIFALCFTAIFGMVAIAVDYGRISSVSTKLTAALDRAALAGAKLIQDDDVTESAVQDRAQAFFNSQIQILGIPVASVGTFNAVVDLDKGSVTASIPATVASTFAKVIGINTFKLNPSATAVYKMKKIELSLALDLTGSMNDAPAGETATKLESLKVAAKEVVDTMFANAVNDKGVRIALAPYSASVNPGSLTSSVTGGTTSTGCVRERPGSENATDSKPQGQDALVTYSAGSDGCPSESVTPLVGRSQKEALKTKIDTYTGSGWTAGHLGTAWGWYLLSPEWNNVLPSQSKPNKYDNNTEVVKNIVIMSDGLFNTSYLSGYSPDSAGATDESYTQFQALCAGMKVKKINIYTVLYGLDDSRAIQEMKTCASSPGNYFTAANGNELKTVFRNITTSLNSMRMTK